MRQIAIIATGCIAAFVMLATPAGATAYRHHYGAAHPHRYVVYPSGSRLADPSFMPNPLLDFYRRYNVCAIDEGYGRVTRCN